MPRLDSPVPPPTIYGAPDALGRVAVAQYAPGMLTRGGSPQRAARLVAKGWSVHAASRSAAAQGKGHIAETQLAAGYGARAGAMLLDYHARPNPVANDPAVDVQVRRAGQTCHGVQVKVGTEAYLRRALRKGGGVAIVANAEARDALIERRAIAPRDVADRLAYRGSESPQLTAADSAEAAVEAITGVLEGRASNTEVALLGESLRAGVTDGALSFVMSMVAEFGECVWVGRAFDVGRAIDHALRAGLRSVARTSVQTRMLVGDFLARARAQFSGRLVHRVARSAVVAGALAEVIVETAIDLAAVLRREMTLDEWCRRAGVHVTTAAGGAAGAALAYAVFAGAHPAVLFGAVLLSACLGAKVGRQLGEGVFQPGLPAPLPTR